MHHVAPASSMSMLNKRLLRTFFHFPPTPNPHQTYTTTHTYTSPQKTMPVTPSSSPPPTFPTRFVPTGKTFSRCRKPPPPTRWCPLTTPMNTGTPRTTSARCWLQGKCRWVGGLGLCVHVCVFVSRACPLPLI